MDVLEKSSTGLDANVAAALAYLAGFITGIIFVAVEKDSRFVKFHAFQSLIFFVGYFIIWSVLWAVAWWIMWILALPVSLAVLMLWLFLMFKAYQGEKFKLPIIGDIAEKMAGN